MGINKDYLKEFCENFGVLQKGILTERNIAKIKYTFGTPVEVLKGINSYEKLEETINKYSFEKSKLMIDLGQEVEENFFDFK